jgi:hypothetical protein
LFPRKLRVRKLRYRMSATANFNSTLSVVIFFRL